MDAQLLGVMDIFDFVLIYFSKVCADIFILNANESAECVEAQKITLLSQQKYITGYLNILTSNSVDVRYSNQSM